MKQQKNLFNPLIKETMVNTLEATSRHFEGTRKLVRRCGGTYLHDIETETIDNILAMGALAIGHVADQHESVSDQELEVELTLVDGAGS